VLGHFGFCNHRLCFANRNRFRTYYAFSGHCSGRKTPRSAGSDPRPGWRECQCSLVTPRLFRAAASHLEARALTQFKEEVSAAIDKPGTPFTIGWTAAKANAVPALVLQASMLGLLAAYYLSPTAARALQNLAKFKRENALVFVVAASITAGADSRIVFDSLFSERSAGSRQSTKSPLHHSSVGL
jgi:hypothetical protein